MALSQFSTSAATRAPVPRKFLDLVSTPIRTRRARARTHEAATRAPVPRKFLDLVSTRCPENFLTWSAPQYVRGAHAHARTRPLVKDQTGLDLVSLCIGL
jgi:hypothetical protein